MKKTLFLRLCLLIIVLFSLQSCSNEDLAAPQKDPQRKNADFFKHHSGNRTASRSVDYIGILEAHNEETGFVYQMPDQEGMPIWDKMQVFGSEAGAGLIIPLSYDEEYLSSVLFATFDPENRVKAVRNITNQQLEEMINNREYSKDFRQGLLTSFLIADHHTFGTGEFTNIPQDLYEDVKHGKDNTRLSFNAFSVGESTGSVSGRYSHTSTICLNIYHCKNNKPMSSCDGCSSCVTKTCSSTHIFTDDDDVIPPPPGGDGGGGSGGGISYPPQDPCAPVNAFYRLRPNCGDTGGIGGIPLDDPCEKLKTQIENSEFANRVGKLEDSLNLKREIGYTEDSMGFHFKDVATSTDGSNSLTLGDPTQGMKGYMHIHPNDWVDADGATRTGFKIFSPADVIYFNQIVALAQQENRPLVHVYAVMVSGKGNYQIRFTGNVNQIKTVYVNTKKQYNEMYIKYFTKNAKVSDELNFLKFIDEQMYVKGITLVKMNDDGTFTKKTLSPDKTQVIDEDCL